MLFRSAWCCSTRSAAATDIRELSLRSAGTADGRRPTENFQLPLFSTAHPTLERLKAVDPNTLTPLESLTLLDSLVDEARRG